MKRFSPLPLTLAVLALVVGLARVPSALAQAPEPRHGRGAHVEDRLQQSLQQLGLNESQQTTVQTLLRTQAKERIRLRAEIDAMRVDLRQLLRADTVDLNSVKAALQAIAAKEVDLQTAHFTLLHDIRQILTSDQRKQFQSLLLARGGGEPPQIPNQARVTGRCNDGSKVTVSTGNASGRCTVETNPNGSANGVTCNDGSGNSASGTCTASGAQCGGTTGSGECSL